MSILITGASGFIGSKLIKRLIADQVEIVALSRNHKPVEFDHYKNLQWHKCDLLSDNIDISLFPKIETVIHLAGATLGANIDETKFLEKNEQAAIKVLQVFAPYVRRVIYASSQVVYGDARNLSVDEQFPIMPYTSAYACSKSNCETWLRWFQRQYGGVYIALRFCGFIDGGGVVDYIVNSAMANKPIELFANGLIRRDYIHSSIGIEAIVGSIKYKGKEEFLPINIGSGQVLSTKELSNLICDELNSSSIVSFSNKSAPQGDFVFSIEKAKKLLKYNPGSLIESVRNYAKAKKVNKNYPKDNF